MRFTLALVPLLACAGIVSALACETSSQCQACPSGRPRRCETGRCVNNLCTDLVCVATNQQCPVRLRKRTELRLYFRAADAFLVN